jgi:hypothetical protein
MLHIFKPFAFIHSAIRPSSTPHPVPHAILPAALVIVTLKPRILAESFCVYSRDQHDEEALRDKGELGAADSI